MNEKYLYKLKYNAEFRKLSFPITAENYVALEQDILRNGYNKQLYAWNLTLLADYEQYEICQKHNISFSLSHIFAKSREEVTAWICRKELERNDLPDVMNKYLIGKLSLMERILFAHEIALSRASKKAYKTLIEDKMPRYDDNATKTRERLGVKHHISYITVRKYEILAQAIDIIYDSSAEFAVNILSDNVKISQECIIEISKMSSKEVKAMSEAIIDEKTTKKCFSQSRKLISRASNNILINTTGSIKDMPQYDPDSEVASLSLTIPSWISSINRISKVSEFSNISEAAKKRLINELESLRNTVDDMITALKEA